MRVHNVIPQLLHTRRWTLGKLAERSGVDKGHLSRIVSGKTVPGVLHAWKIAAAFNLGIEEVFRFRTQEVSDVYNAVTKDCSR